MGTEIVLVQIQDELTEVEELIPVKVLTIENKKKLMTNFAPPGSTVLWKMTLYYDAGRNHFRCYPQIMCVGMKAGEEIVLEVQENLAMMKRDIALHEVVEISDDDSKENVRTVPGIDHDKG